MGLIGGYMGLVDEWAERHIINAQENGELDKQHQDYPNLHKRLVLLELRLKQAGLSTDFLHKEYQHKVADKLSKEE